MHFYTQKGGVVESRHEVTQSKDKTKTRPSRVTDAIKARNQGEVWYPSVTTIMNMLDKPALVNWKIEAHLAQAYLVPAGLTLDEYIAEVKARTEDELDKAPKAGTDIHKMLEDHLFVSVPEDPIHAKIVRNIEAKLTELGITNPLKEKLFVDDSYGFAGCADLVGNGWIIDYKSKQEASKFKVGKMAYPDHARQLGAYSMGINGVIDKAANIFICLENGEIDFHAHSKEALQNGFDDFVDCLRIFNRNTYKPEL